MTTKGFITTLLCAYGYDRRIKIEYDKFYKAYFIEASNKDGHEICISHAVSLIDVISQITYCMNENCVSVNWRYVDTPLKYIINDNLRNEMIRLEDEQNQEDLIQAEKLKPIFKWRDENNPCITCTINKKDHWDSIHYNCELHHFHSCKILLEFEEIYKNKIHEKETHDPY